jgi:hypothetical protein
LEDADAAREAVALHGDGWRAAKAAGRTPGVILLAEDPAAGVDTSVARNLFKRAGFVRCFESLMVSAVLGTCNFGEALARAIAAAGSRRDGTTGGANSVTSGQFVAASETQADDGGATACAAARQQVPVSITQSLRRSGTGKEHIAAAHGAPVYGTTVASQDQSQFEAASDFRPLPGPHPTASAAGAGPEVAGFASLPVSRSVGDGSARDVGDDDASGGRSAAATSRGTSLASTQPNAPVLGGVAAAVGLAGSAAAPSASDLPPRPQRAGGEVIVPAVAARVARAAAAGNQANRPTRERESARAGGSVTASEAPAAAVTFCAGQSARRERQTDIDIPAAVAPPTAPAPVVAAGEGWLGSARGRRGAQPEEEDTAPRAAPPAGRSSPHARANGAAGAEAAPANAGKAGGDVIMAAAGVALNEEAPSSLAAAAVVRTVATGEWIAMGGSHRRARAGGIAAWAPGAASVPGNGVSAPLHDRFAGAGESKGGEGEDGEGGEGGEGGLPAAHEALDLAGVRGADEYYNAVIDPGLPLRVTIRSTAKVPTGLEGYYRPPADHATGGAGNVKAFRKIPAMLYYNVTRTVKANATIGIADKPEIKDDFAAVAAEDRELERAETELFAAAGAGGRGGGGKAASAAHGVRASAVPVFSAAGASSRLGGGGASGGGGVGGTARKRAREESSDGEGNPGGGAGGVIDLADSDDDEDASRAAAAASTAPRKKAKLRAVAEEEGDDDGREAAVAAAAPRLAVAPVPSTSRNRGASVARRLPSASVARAVLSSRADPAGAGIGIGLAPPPSPPSPVQARAPEHAPAPAPASAAVSGAAAAGRMRQAPLTAFLNHAATAAPAAAAAAPAAAAAIGLMPPPPPRSRGASASVARRR